MIRRDKHDDALRAINRVLVYARKMAAEKAPCGLDAEVVGECLAPFNLSEALGVWDEDHRRAFISWVEAPFWP